MLSPEALKIAHIAKGAFWRLFQARTFRTASLIHATSDHEYEAIRARGIKNPVAVLPIGVEAPEQDEARSALTKTVLYLGRLHPIKGLDLLLEAWRQVKQSGFRDWRLRIVGPEGFHGYKELLERRVHEGSIPHVTFRMAVTGTEKWREYRAATITVLPSRSENFGITVAESLLVGTPVIATDRTPWQDLSEKGCGWSVPLGSESIASAMVSAMSLGEPALAAMGIRGRTWVLERFLWRKIAANMADAYRWIQAGGPVPACVRID